MFVILGRITMKDKEREEQKRKSFEMLVQMFEELDLKNNLNGEEKSLVALAVNETLNIGFDFSNINLIENGN